MKVRFRFESELSWDTERIVEVKSYASAEDIEAMFPEVLNVNYNPNNCFYEAIDGRRMVRLSQMLAYTE